MIIMTMSRKTPRRLAASVPRHFGGAVLRDGPKNDAKMILVSLTRYEPSLPFEASCQEAA